MKKADKGRYTCWRWGEGDRGNVGDQDADKAQC